ncbi:MAG: FHA domain-containing protein [Anaerolineales bacterium]|nr:FHA domain-containing protein [Anaerolineales bacterium]
MTSWRLFTVLGPISGKTTSLVDLIRFGREAENEICIPDGQVSRQHAQIEKTDAGYLLTDLNSTNGTFLNDKRLTHPTYLRIGDAITIGPARFLVLAEPTGTLES